jgi:zeta-carotene desaturase
MTHKPQKVLIVGGGLAGMAAAVGLAAHGLAVTLLESRHALGGRASSFEDQEQPGELLDNCQHVLLGCCTNLLDLYRRLGVGDKVAFHGTVHFLDDRGRRHDLWGLGAGVPAPLHLGPSMGFFSALSFSERTAVVRAMLAMLRLGRSGRERLESTAFGEWLDRHRQPAAVVKKFYDPVVVSALNEETRKASAKYAIQVFQEAMLANRRGYVVGLPACPLGDLYARLPAGIDVRLNARVDELLFESDSTGATRASGVKLRNGDVLHADAVVLATNHHAVQRWVAALPPDVLARDGRFAGLDKLESVPILGVHLWFDRPIMREASAALIEGPLQWLFRKDADGRQLHGVISAARDWPPVPKEEALRQFEAQIRHLFPAARDAALQRGVIVIEKRATFAPLPGTDHLRPAQAPPPNGLANLYLAGDYTKTDWPATMEGAVRSGYLAAQAVLSKTAAPTPQLLIPDLPVQWPARLFGLAR